MSNVTIQTLLENMYNVVSKNGQITDQLENDYHSIMNNYHDAVLRELDNTILHEESPIEE